MIQIKELLSSDSLSALAEKVNFNFDQLVLAGGGPPGPSGQMGPSGPPGPIGRRGSRWFAGVTATPGPTSLPSGGSLEENDQLIQVNGDVYTYFDVLGSTGWTYSGVNLMGPTGPAGSTGGSLEWQYYAGYTGSVQDAAQYGPTSMGPSSPTADVDFIIPVQAEKNGIFVGDRIWAYDYLSDFNVYPVGTDQFSVPKMTLIQSRVGYEGNNGLMFGAMGLTSGSGPSIPAVGVTSVATSAYDFVSMGFVREAVAQEYHRFRVNSFRMPMLIRVGGDDFGYGPADLEVSSRRFILENYSSSGAKRFIRSTEAPVSVSPYVSPGTTHSFIELSATPDQFAWYRDSLSTTSGTAGYISLQSVSGTFAPPASGVNHAFGSVFIGPTYSNDGPEYVPFLFGDPFALGISRPIKTISGNVDSSIKFFSPGNLQGGPNDFLSKIVASYAVDPNPGSDGSSELARLQISATRLGINSRFDLNASKYVPRFPLHLAQDFLNLTAAGPVGPWQGQYWETSLSRWLAGFDSQDSSSLGIGGTGYQGKGLGIAYSAANPFGGNTEVVLQTYYTGATGILDGSAGVAGSGSAFRSPNLFLQVGDESNSGNLGIGFTLPLLGDGSSFPQDPFKVLRSKLSVSGSARIGSRQYFESQHQDASWKLTPRFGLAVQGSILQGATYYNPTSDAIPTVAGFTVLIGPTYGVFTPEKVIANVFVATRGKGTNTDPAPSFALPDVRTGLRGSTMAGDAYMQVGAGNNFFDVTRWSQGGEDNTEFAKMAFQVLRLAAKKPYYMSASTMANLTTPVAGPTGSGYWSLTTIPVEHSVIKFDGNGFHDAGSGTPSWRQIYENANAIPSGQNVYMVELEQGYYDGQELELVFTGWGNPSLLATPFLRSDFVLRNDAKYAYSAVDRSPRMLLQREFNGGGYSSTIGIAGNGNSAVGLPFPFPHGATQSGSFLGSGSLDTLNWSSEGQFSCFGYRSITLRWTRVIPDGIVYPSYYSKYRWVEVARTQLSEDLTRTGLWIGDPGNT